MKQNQFKVIVAGDPGIGKTAMLHRFCVGEFASNSPGRFDDDKMRMDCFEKQFLGGNDEDVFWLCFFDLFNNDAIPDSFYVGAHGGILVFSTTDAKSFESLEKWLTKVRSKCGDIPLVLVQTKLDLIDQAALDSEAVDRKAREWRLRLYRVSAQENLNIDELFSYIAAKCKQFLKLTEISEGGSGSGSNSRASSAKSVNWDLTPSDQQTTDGQLDNDGPSKRRTGGTKPVFNRHKKVCSVM